MKTFNEGTALVLMREGQSLVRMHTRHGAGFWPMVSSQMKSPKGSSRDPMLSLATLGCSPVAHKPTVSTAAGRRLDHG
jgi:hypothetical protein